MVFSTTLKLSGFFALLIGTITPPVCNSFQQSDSDQNRVIQDIPDILKRKRLIALTDNSTTSYFIYKGEPMGYEYEMLQAFADHLGVELRVIIARDLNTVLDQLENGEVDLVCANLTVTEERMERSAFSSPLLHTRQVLIQKKPEGWEKMNPEQISESMVRTTIDLSGKNIYIRKGSSFRERLDNLEEEIAAEIPYIEVPGEVTTEELIARVAVGKIPYTIADENVARVNQRYYPNIDISTAISFPQKIAWAVNKKSPLLLAEVNNWLEKYQKSGQNDILYAKYFRNSKFTGKWAESEYSSTGGSRISPFDDMIRVYARELGWDWRLLASMIYQESRFDPEARSWAGASGLMQMIPATAEKYGLDTCQATPIESIDAGTRHLQQLEAYWKKLIPNPSERIQFTLASYNAGLGHVIDARKLAHKYGKDHNKWQENVDQYLLMKSDPKYYNDPIVHCGYCRGEEPYRYVREILIRFGHYRNIIHENSTESAGLKPKKSKQI